MSSILKVDTIQDQSGNNIINENADTITIGASGDTVTIPSGATLDASGATLTLPTTIEVDAIEPQSGTSLTLGASGDTITIPSGATLTNSGTATGFGKVLQVVQGTRTSNYTTTSTSFNDTGLTVSITPSLATSKVLIIVNHPQVYVEHTGSNIHNYTNIILLRDATQLKSGSIGTFNYASSTTPSWYTSYSLSHLDSPNTTSSVTYKTQGQAAATVSTTLFMGGSATIINSIIAMEIGV
jgi:hypothetical protein